MLNKNKIILFGALAISLLLNFPRLIVLLTRKDIVESLGLTFEEVVLRTLVLFCFSWLALSYNIKWKNEWIVRKNGYAVLTDIIVNGLLLLIGVATLTFFKQFIPGFIIDVQSYIFVAFFTYLVVLIILLLISWLVNLMTQHQQSLLEKEQAKQKALHHQLEALRAQINPHFLFNTLNSLSSLIRQKSDKASVFVDKLSWMLRVTLQQSDKDYVTLQEELEYLEAYVFLQKERFGDKLNIEVDIPDDWKKQRTPSFSLQLLVENAIKHNVVSNKQPLHIRIYSKEDFLVISNPIQKRSDLVESTGKGLSNLSTRFQLLRKKDIQIEKKENQFIVKLPIL